VAYTNPPGSPNQVDGNNDAQALRFEGPYMVRPDCTGYSRATFLGPHAPPPFNVAFVIVDIRDGRAQEVLFTQNSSGNFVSGRVRLIRSDE
jgi:hypothetical protein